VLLIHKSDDEFDIEVWKDPTATRLIAVGIVCSAISAEILEALVHQGFLDPKDDADLVHSEVLLKE
jgi:hypothetical protein